MKQEKEMETSELKEQIMIQTYELENKEGI